MPMHQITVPDRILQTVQTNAAKAISQIESATQINAFGGASDHTSIPAPFFGGNLIVGLTLAAGQVNLVAHGLQRTPVVWVLCGQDTNTTVWAQTANANPSEFLLLECAATCTVSLWVA